MANKRITITDVAREAGISAQTVSRVLNGKAEITEETRSRVLKVINRLGYRPNPMARGLVTNKTFSIGLVVPDIANPVFPEITRGIEDVAWQRGYSLILCNSGEDAAREEAAIESLLDKRVDGIIVASSRLPDKKLWQLLKKHRAAVVINRQAPAEVAGTVVVDDSDGAQQAVQHLLGCNRTKIGFLAGPISSRSGQQRADGFRLALQKAGLQCRPQWQVPCLPEPSGGLDGATELLARYPEIDGLVCYNDLVAIGVIQACGKLGISIPEKLAVVGFDNTTLASLVHPTITSVYVEKYRVGADAISMLMERIGGKKDHQPVIHKPSLVIRESSVLDNKESIK